MRGSAHRLPAAALAGRGILQVAAAIGIPRVVRAARGLLTALEAQLGSGRLGARLSHHVGVVDDVEVVALLRRPLTGQRLAGASLRPGNGPDGLLGVRVLTVQVAAAVMPEGEESAAPHPGATLLALINAVHVAPCVIDWKVLHVRHLRLEAGLAVPRRPAEGLARAALPGAPVLEVAAAVWVVGVVVASGVRLAAGLARLRGVHLVAVSALHVVVVDDVEGEALREGVGTCRRGGKQRTFGTGVAQQLGRLRSAGHGGRVLQPQGAVVLADNIDVLFPQGLRRPSQGCRKQQRKAARGHHAWRG
mmetsp:Transcript_46122/g.142680  ORF Transcript_46122/g.142680 Transcript_46122/m.142680 type:complete len:305 (-) Transcript_46122:11-925(-)